MPKVTIGENFGNKKDDRNKKRFSRKESKKIKVHELLGLNTLKYNKRTTMTHFE